jgi:hypothetical protein
LQKEETKSWTKPSKIKATLSNSLTEFAKECVEQLQKKCLMYNLTILNLGKTAMNCKLEAERKIKPFRTVVNKPGTKDLSVLQRLIFPLEYLECI